MQRRRFLQGLAGAATGALALACDRRRTRGYAPTFSVQAPGGDSEYLFGIHPLHNPERLFAIYHPIAEHLQSRIPGTRFRLEASRNYEEFEKKLYAGRFHFALPNPLQTVKALDHGYRVFGKMGNDEDFRGLLLVRRDSGILRVQDLKGKSVSYPAATALAACLMPQYYLHTHGLDVNRDIQNLYVGSQESSIMNVYLGNVAAGATWPVPWKTFLKEHLDRAAALEVRWQTETLPNNSLMVRNDLPDTLTNQVGALLFSLGTHEEGRRMLERIPIPGFEPATSATYAPVRAYLKRFAAEVRPLPD